MFIMIVHVYEKWNTCAYLSFELGWMWVDTTVIGISKMWPWLFAARTPWRWWKSPACDLDCLQHAGGDGNLKHMTLNDCSTPWRWWESQTRIRWTSCRSSPASFTSATSRSSSRATTRASRIPRVRVDLYLMTSSVKWRSGMFGRAVSFFIHQHVWWNHTSVNVALDCKNVLVQNCYTWKFSKCFWENVITDLRKSVP